MRPSPSISILPLSSVPSPPSGSTKLGAATRRLPRLSPGVRTGSQVLLLLLALLALFKITHPQSAYLHHNVSTRAYPPADHPRAPYDDAEAAAPRSRDIESAQRAWENTRRKMLERAGGVKEVWDEGRAAEEGRGERRQGARPAGAPLGMAAQASSLE